MGDEEQLFLQRVERENEGFAGLGQVGQLRLQRRHVVALEAHHIRGSINCPARGVDHYYIPWHHLQSVDDLRRKPLYQRRVARRDHFLARVFGVADDPARQVPLRRRVLGDVVVDGVVASRQDREKKSDRDPDQSRHECRRELEAGGQHLG